ncbi:MAG: hypothetical protein ACRYG8_04025, partial [Janthinobacterium lividum]
SFRLIPLEPTMARYRVYLMDEAEFVQKTAAVECGSDAEAMAYARTLIRQGGPVDLWTDDVVVTAMIGWFRPRSGPLSGALVRRARTRWSHKGPVAHAPRLMCHA